MRDIGDILFLTNLTDFTCFLFLFLLCLSIPRDAIPATIPYGGKYLSNGSTAISDYAFVGTGIHVYGNRSSTPGLGSANMYGQNYDVCMDSTTDPRCAGGNSEADHYFYYTDIVSLSRFYMVLLNIQ